MADLSFRQTPDEGYAQWALRNLASLMTAMNLPVRSGYIPLPPRGMMPDQPVPSRTGPTTGELLQLGSLALLPTPVLSQTGRALRFVKPLGRSMTSYASRLIPAGWFSDVPHYLGDLVQSAFQPPVEERYMWRKVGEFPEKPQEY